MLLVVSNRFLVGVSLSFVSFPRFLTIFFWNSGCVLMPVPSAVPPIPSSWRFFMALSISLRSFVIAVLNDANSWPSVTGTASCKWVRPVFRIFLNSLDFFWSALVRFFPDFMSDGASRSIVSRIAVGITSLLDCDMFTWLLGWTNSYVPFFPPRISLARLARISLVFMWNGVPAPAWKMSSWKSSLNAPSMSSSAAFWIAFDFLESRTWSPSFVMAAAFLMRASDFLKAAGALILLMWKFSSARVVKEP